MPKPSLCHRTPPVVRARYDDAFPPPGPASLSTQDTRCSSQQESTACPSTSPPALFSSTASLWPHALLPNGGIALPEPRMEQAPCLLRTVGCTTGRPEGRLPAGQGAWATSGQHRSAHGQRLLSQQLTVSFPKITGSEASFSLFFLPTALPAWGRGAASTPQPSPCIQRSHAPGARSGRKSSWRGLPIPHLKRRLDYLLTWSLLGLQ